MLLTTLQEQYEETYLDFIHAFKDNNEEIIPFGADNQGMEFQKFLELSRNYETGKGIPEEHATAHTFYLVVNEEIVGAINCRHELKGLLNTFGHIGYGVKPGFRRRGYANKMLELALDKYRDMGIDRVLISCDRDNVASAKTIVRHGGILENEIPNPVEEGITVQRYWVELS